MAIELILILELEKLSPRLFDIALEWLLREAKIGLVSTQPLGQGALELDVHNATAARAEDRGVVGHGVVVRRMIECPDVRKDQTGKLACGDLFEYAASELADEALKWRCAIGKEPEREIDRVVVMEEFEASPLCQLMPDRHFTDGRRTYDEHKGWTVLGFAHLGRTD